MECFQRVGWDHFLGITFLQSVRKVASCEVPTRQLETCSFTSKLSTAGQTLIFQGDLEIVKIARPARFVVSVFFVNVETHVET